MDYNRQSSYQRNGKRAKIDPENKRGKAKSRGSRAGVKKSMTKCEQMDRRSLRIISWNIRSHTKRRVVVEQLLQSNNIIALQEIKIKKKPSYGQHNVFFKESSSNGKCKRGLLTIVRSGIECCQVKTPNAINEVETLAVAFRYLDQQYVLVNIYVPPNALKNEAEWSGVLEPLLSLGERVIITGDYNARSQLWCDTDSNTNGKSLDEAYTNLDCIIMNDYGPTRVAERPGDTDSCIDLTLASPDLAPQLIWRLLPLLGSDHKPVLLKIRKPFVNKPKPSRSRCKFSYDTSEGGVIGFIRSLKTVQNKDREPVCTWVNCVKVQKAWDAKMRASKEYSKAKKNRLDPIIIDERRQAYNQAVREYEEIAQEERQAAWDRFCAVCDPRDRTVINKFWKLAKVLKNVETEASPSPQEIEDSEGNILRSDEEKGNAFLKRYLSQLQQDSQEQLRRKWSDVHLNIDKRTIWEKESKVTESEVRNIIANIAKDTTPGPDRVTYSRLKSVADDEMLLSELVDVINITLKEGEIPEDWRDCNLSVIPKPNKNHRVLKGYRIITMANVLVKLCEKIAARRLVEQLERTNKISTNVGGARPRRSTTSNVEALLHIMQEGLQSNSCYALGLFDLEDAYNTVHIPTLAGKMMKYGISDVMIRWILSMLDSRRCHMRFGNWTSNTFNVSSGLPQGSPLSCVLFNIYTADIISWTKDDDIDPFSYVDDIIICCESESPVEAVEKLQSASDKLESWTVENHMRIQPDKVCWMLVTLRHVDRLQLSLSYAQEKVRQEKEVTYLGVVIDCRLSMLSHITNNLNKAKKALGVVRYAAGQNVQLKSLVNLVRATVVSRLEYALHVCCPVSKSQFNRMDKLLNQALRIISGAAQKTSGEALQFYLGFHNMEQQYKMKVVKEFARAVTTITHPLNALLTEQPQVNVRLKIVQPWSRLGEELVEKLYPGGHIISDLWVCYNKGYLKIDIIGNRNWREVNPVVNQSNVDEYIDAVQANIIIATDGSLSDSTTAWAGVVWKSRRRIFSWSTCKNNKTSSFRAESEGFEDALVWINKCGTCNDRVALLTDSKSLVLKLKSGLVKESWVALLDNMKSTLHIAYIPGHAGIRYNEAADHLAGIAEPVGAIKLNYNDISNRLRDEINSNVPEYKTWWSLKRLKDSGLQFGDAAKFATRRNETKFKTQSNMGLVTLSTLHEILRKGWPGSQIP